MFKKEVLQYLLIALFSVLLLFMSLTGLVGFFSLDFISEFIKELFTGINLFSSRLFFIQFALLGLTAVFFHWTAILGLCSKNLKPTLWISFIGSMMLLALNGYCLLNHGFNWMGYEFFHGQSIADNRIFQLAGVAYFLVVFSMTALTGSMLFKKGDAGETKE